MWYIKGRWMWHINGKPMAHIQKLCINNKWIQYVNKAIITKYIIWIKNISIKKKKQLVHKLEKK